MADQVRTPDELGKIEFNYYEAYQIPLEETDTEAIKKKINMLCAKKANSSNPIDIRIGKDLKNEALAIMSDPGQRAKEAAAYKRLKMEGIRQFVVSLCSRGVINKSELQQIATKNKVAFDELEKEIKPLLSKVKYIDDTQNLFDFSTYENSEKYLKGYLNGKFTNLFELLDLTLNCSVNEAKNKLDADKKANASQTQKKTPDGVGLKNLYGEAGKIFSGDAAKHKAYVKYVRIKDTVYAPLKARKDNGLTNITQDEYLDFLQLLTKGLNEQIPEAEQDLAAILKYCGIKLTGAANFTLELCPYPDCGKPYVAAGDIKACPHCGRSFEVACWNCKGSMHMGKGAQACPHCGVTEKAQKEFNTKLGALDLIMRNPKCTVAELKNGLSALIAVVPSYARVATSETAKKVKFYNEEIAKKETAEQGNLKVFMESIAEIDKHIALKKFRKAEMLLSDLRKKIPGYNTPVVEKYAKDIAAAIGVSDTFMANAKRFVASNNESQAIENAVKALEACADNTEAQQILRKVPPAKPLSLACSVKNDKSAYLEWTVAPGQKFVTYSIVRKIGTKPTSATDGTVIAQEITLNFFEDTAITAATPYYYGVFAERYGVQSPLIAAATSVSAFPDVTDCNQEMVEGKIKIKWSCPAGATVRVRKQKGTVAPGADSGAEIKTEANNGFIDGDCDSTGCSYFVYCEYDVAGAKKRSKGIQLYYKPYYIPKAINNLTLYHTDSGEWALKGENFNDNTKLYLFAQKPVFGVKKVEPMHRFTSAAGGVSIGVVKSGEDFVFTVPDGKSGWLYAVNMNDQLFVAAEPIFVTGEKGISNVKYTEKNGTVTITCDLSANVYQVLVKISNVKFATSTEDNGANYTFATEQIKRNGGISIKIPADSVSYITLFAFVGNNKSHAECAPVPLDDAIDYRKKQVVKYCLEYEPNPAKAFSVTIKFEADVEVELPDFLIVKGSPRPMNKNVGELAAEVKGVELKKGLFTHGKYCAKAVVKATPMAKFYKLAMFVAEDGNKNVQMKEVTKL